MLAFLFAVLLFPSICLGQNQALTSFVNLFIGTETGANGGSGGNAFPGAAIPHAMVKVSVIFFWPVLVYAYFLQAGIDVDIAPRQAGYISQVGSITGKPITFIIVGVLKKDRHLTIT